MTTTRPYPAATHYRQAPLGQERAHFLGSETDESLGLSFPGRLKNDRIGAGFRQAVNGRGRTSGIMVGDVQVDDQAVLADTPGGGLPLGDKPARTADFLRPGARDQDGPVGGLSAQRWPAARPHHAGCLPGLPGWNVGGS